jgi:hypothetical protein
MRLATMFLVLGCAVAIGVALYFLSGGHVVLFVLPLVLAGPLIWRGRRG